MKSILKDSKRIMFILIAIITVIGCTTGSTFAYFTSTVRSKKENVNTKSKNIQVHMELDYLYTPDYIIPLDDYNIDKAINNSCIDEKEKGEKICKEKYLM